MPHEWRHRTQVYKFGALWVWKCCKYGCHGGRDREFTRSFTAAWVHASIGGYTEYGDRAEG